MEDNTYICAMCKGEFVKGWTDEEAENEGKRFFGEIPESEKAVVCDDCFNKIHPNKFPIATQIAKRELEELQKSTRELLLFGETMRFVPKHPQKPRNQS